jgi:hypothetical protein
MIDERMSQPGYMTGGKRLVEGQYEPLGRSPRAFIPDEPLTQEKVDDLTVAQVAYLASQE